jgi:hypothetical protein
VQLEQPAQERPCVVAGQVAALDECNAMCEISERQPAGETRTVSALRRIGGRHELSRSAAAQTTTPPQLLCFRHEVETRGPQCPSSRTFYSFPVCGAQGPVEAVPVPTGCKTSVTICDGTPNPPRL